MTEKDSTGEAKDSVLKETPDEPLYIFPIPPEFDLIPDTETLEVPLTNGESVIVDFGVRPFIGTSNDLAEFKDQAQQAGELKGDFDKARKDLVKANKNITETVKAHVGLRGYTLPEQGLVVEVNPKRSRRVKDPQAFKDELGVLFPFVAKDVLNAKFTIPENITDNDGNPITSETITEIIEDGLKSKGVSKRDIKKLVALKRDIEVKNWEDIAKLIRLGHLSVSNLEANTSYEVRVDALERTQGSRSSKKTNR